MGRIVWFSLLICFQLTFGYREEQDIHAYLFGGPGLNQTYVSRYQKDVLPIDTQLLTPLTSRDFKNNINLFIKNTCSSYKHYIKDHFNLPESDNMFSAEYLDLNLNYGFTSQSAGGLNIDYDVFENGNWEDEDHDEYHDEYYDYHTDSYNDNTTIHSAKKRSVQTNDIKMTEIKK